MRDSFSTYHPSINFLYFGFVILVTIFLFHPVLLAISFVSSMAYSIYLNGKKAVKFNLLGLVPMMLLAAFVNVAFNHEGITILTYWGGNPITLESIQFGIASGCMLVSVIMWFSCYNKVMTSDKFVYLFGRLIPALSMIFSMALRFVPKFKAEIKKISNAQRCLGRDVSAGNWLIRVRHGMKILSIMVTWALENAVETADSMKSRGYGLKHRTAYSIYRLDARDKSMLAVLGALLLFIFVAIVTKTVWVRYFPSFGMNDSTPLSSFACTAFAIVCMLPLLLQIKEEATWRSLISKV